MSARNLRFRIVRIEVNIRKDPTVSVPTSDVSLDIAQHELLAG
jgi:hypothetical protein